MSGRSAIVRQKINKGGKDKQAARPDAHGRSSFEGDEYSGYHAPSRPLGTGIGTTNARFLKFSEPLMAPGQEPPYDQDAAGISPIGSPPMSIYGNNAAAGGYGSGSASGSSSAPGSRAGGPRQPFQNPYSQYQSSAHVFAPDDYAPTFKTQHRAGIRTEDVSGIEKSDLRNIIDKRSDGVRKGLAKAFAFKKKDKDEERRNSADRPESASTLRPNISADGASYDSQPPHMGRNRLSSIGSVQRYPYHEPQPVYDSHRHMPQANISPQTHSPMHQKPLPLPPLSRQQQQQQQQQQLQQQQQQQQRPQLYGPVPLEPSDNDPWDAHDTPGPPPAAKLPPLPPSATSNPVIKRWIGAGRPVARWNKLRKDPELWDPNGDVLIFLGHKGQTPRPPPSFRLSSHMIEATESRYLVTLLREGCTEDNVRMPPSPASGGLASRGQHLTRKTGGRGEQPTPPTSEDANEGEADGEISYEMYFPTPSNLNKTERLRYQLTTRNVFALLYHASLVGLTLHQALSDLHTRLNIYMPAESDNIELIIEYLAARGIDDVRSDPDSAVSLLAWAENPQVRWEDGWSEALVHCAGMYHEVERSPEFQLTTSITKALLERAWLETQLRVQSAEERLSSFSYEDMWLGEDRKRGGDSVWSAEAAARRLSLMLIGHYRRIYGNWPRPDQQGQRQQGSPRERHSDDSGGDGEDIWLTRTMALQLQQDFGALYDYLVDRDVVWDGSEARSGRKWELVSESGDSSFEADTPEVPITDMLITFDNRQRFPHIPHPFPLVPESISPVSSRGSSAHGGRSAAIDRRIHLAYTESTNLYELGTDFAHGDLLDAFIRFERADHIGEVDPATARRGRWVLLYGILQTLGSVAVDARGVRYKDGVSYHLGPRLRGAKIPPWGGRGAEKGMGGTNHEMSYCWMAPLTWHEMKAPVTSSEAESSSNSRPDSPATADLSAMRGKMRATTASYGVSKRDVMMPPPTIGAAMDRQPGSPRTSSPKIGSPRHGSPELRSGRSFPDSSAISDTVNNSSRATSRSGGGSGSSRALGRSVSVRSPPSQGRLDERTSRGSREGMVFHQSYEATALPLRGRQSANLRSEQEVEATSTFLAASEEETDEDEEYEEEVRNAGKGRRQQPLLAVDEESRGAKSDGDE